MARHRGLRLRMRRHGVHGNLYPRRPSMQRRRAAALHQKGGVGRRRSSLSQQVRPRRVRGHLQRRGNPVFGERPAAMHRGAMEGAGSVRQSLRVDCDQPAPAAVSANQATPGAPAVRSRPATRRAPGRAPSVPSFVALPRRLRPPPAPGSAPRAPRNAMATRSSSAAPRGNRADARECALRLLVGCLRRALRARPKAMLRWQPTEL